MKFGVRLLLLIVLLLPFRGAMAVAGMLCPPDAGSPAVLVTIDHGGGHAASGQAHGHAHDNRAPGHSGDDHGGAQPAPPCDFCAAICASPPLPVVGAGVPALLSPGAERYPALPPPRSTATYGAPERPPRAA